MATLVDGNFKLAITPEWSGNWWTYHFDFSYQGKPFFNPAIVKKQVFDADEYDRGKKEANAYLLFSVLDGAAQSKTDKETFFWSAWETEVEMKIKLVQIKASVKQKDDSFEVVSNMFSEIEVWIGEVCFVDDGTNMFPQNGGAFRLFVHQEELQRFAEEFKSEMKKLHMPLSDVE